MSIDKRGYKGLYIVDTTAFLRPVQIVRQTISNLETLICPYHNYEGLSIGRKIAGDKEGYTYPYWYNKPYTWHMRICGYEGLGYKGLKV